VNVSLFCALVIIDNSDTTETRFSRQEEKQQILTYFILKMSVKTLDGLFVFL